jgi:hypothetical protein
MPASDPENAAPVDEDADEVSSVPCDRMRNTSCSTPSKLGGLVSLTTRNKSLKLLSQFSHHAHKAAFV